MSDVYSQRNSPTAETYRYDIDAKVRSRILHAIFQIIGDRMGRDSYLLQDLSQKILAQYGSMMAPAYRAASVSDNPVVEHFFSCADEMAIDFIEFCFTSFQGSPGHEGVEAINRIFREEGVGYELTPLVETEVEKDEGGHRKRKYIETQYPKVVRRDQTFTHENIVGPCLRVLSNPKFKVANSEMLKAHTDYRQGNYADSITSCGAAFESVLKTICGQHGWPYDAHKDTCSKLVSICRDNGLFPAFYAPIFEATGTIRNKLGDAHGRGPAPMYVVGKEHVDHMIQMTAAHVVLLVGLSKM